jgi:hypothetical protein
MDESCTDENGLSRSQDKAALDHNDGHLSSGIAVYSNWILHRAVCIVKKSRSPRESVFIM